MDEEILDLLRATPDLTKLVYKDLAQPSVKKVGQALEAVIDTANTILLPLKLLNERTKFIFSKNLEKYRKQLEDIPNKGICKVLPEIGVPILDKLTYVSDEDISDLFVNLLAKASTLDTVNSAHPSFIHIINSISSDEAKILAFLKDKSLIPYIGCYPSDNRPDATELLPRYLTGIEIELELLFPNNARMYLENLIGLGLLICYQEIEVDPNHSGILRKAHQSLESQYNDQIGGLRTKYSLAIGIEKAYFEITDYAKMFINACTTKLKAEQA